MRNDDHLRRLHELLIENLYSQPILNNSHRGDFVEMMVLDALGSDWKHVGLGWNIWDLQRGTGDSRVRVQVRQGAALQRWGSTKRRTVQLGWKAKLPTYVPRDFPNEVVEDDGWFCELFVVGLHDDGDEKTCDQTDPSQWRFMIIPSCELKRGQKSVALHLASMRWPAVRLENLKAAVEAKIDELKRSGNP